MDIIIAIDIIDGHCVRLEQGDYNRVTSYYNDPLNAAKLLQDNGVKRLHLVDLDGAKAGKIQNIKTLERITKNTKLIVDFGGGVKSKEDVENVLNAGAQMVAIGSMAVKNKAEVLRWADIFGKEKLFIGADVKNERVAINGWLQESEMTVIDLIKGYIEKGMNHFFCTDVSKDGMLSGPATDLYKSLLSSFPQLHLVASGGVSRIEDVYDLEKVGCSGVIIGKAFYENKITFADLKPFLNDAE